MPQANHDTEKQLRQLEDMESPDLSRMEEHWNDMQSILQQSTPAVPKTGITWKWFFGVGIFVITGLLILSINNIGVKKATAPRHENDVSSTTKSTTGQVNTPVEPVSAPKPTAIVIQESLPKKNKPHDNDAVMINLPLQLDPKDSSLVVVAPNRKKLLNDLFTELSKTAQEFIIDNSRDTTLMGAEGSSLFIPAYSIGGGRKIRISFREFYKKSDIVLNKLSTQSNGEQLVTGGMVHISATVNDQPVDVLPGKEIRLFIPDTSSEIGQMELFHGEENSSGHINWVNTGKRFLRPAYVTEVQVLDLRNTPYKVIKKRKGEAAVFLIDKNTRFSRNELRELLKQKYNYQKVRFRYNSAKKGIFKSSVPGNAIGDSTWVERSEAGKFNLQVGQTRTTQSTGGIWNGTILNRGYIKPKYDRVNYELKNTYGNRDTMTFFPRTDVSISMLEKRFSVNINSLGWINCDRFYNDPREKITFAVELDDSASNFITMLVFDKIRSVMWGSVAASQVQFVNVPLGEPVMVISVGINNKGESVMAMKETRISKKLFSGLEFESATAADIKSSLAKDN